jgi:hypothetical protein
MKRMLEAADRYDRLKVCVLVLLAASAMAAVQAAF